MNLLIALIDFYREVVPFLRLHHIYGRNWRRKERKKEATKKKEGQIV